MVKLTKKKGLATKATDTENNIRNILKIFLKPVKNVYIYPKDIDLTVAIR